ncbi:MAG: NADH-quinone oxidoreductase subunit J [Planctomycetia bacterium]|nr:NADH-quinone oxidoreductase subunit J [Planctomycetia bacterium]
MSGVLCAAINWHSLLFLLFAAVACAFAVAVVVADNVVRMALYLVFSLAATSGLFFLAGAEFIGAMQLMIYVGGTLVLLVFGVMLTAQAPFVSIRTAGSDRVLAGIVGAALLAVLLQAAFSVEAWRRPAAGTVVAPSATPLGMALMGMRVDDPPQGGAVAGLRSGYLLPFEIVSVHLLVVLVGAAYLARAKRRRTPRGIEMAGETSGGRAAAVRVPLSDRASAGVSVAGGTRGGRP